MLLGLTIEHSSCLTRGGNGDPLNRGPTQTTETCCKPLWSHTRGQLTIEPLGIGHARHGEENGDPLAELWTQTYVLEDLKKESPLRIANA
jgi:hypothetical protein